MLAGGMMISGLIGSLITLAQVPKPFTESQLRSIVRQALADSFTDISANKGMYAIEGRPRIKALEDGMHRIETKLDQAIKRQGG